MSTTSRTSLTPSHLSFFLTATTTTPLTTTTLLTNLLPLTPHQRSRIHHLLILALPLPLYPTPSASVFCTHSFDSLLPLLLGLHLQTLEILDPFHSEPSRGVDEDGWGAHASYTLFTNLIRKSKGWRELVFRSASDRWLGEVVFRTDDRGDEGGSISDGPVGDIGMKEGEMCGRGERSEGFDEVSEGGVRGWLEIVGGLVEKDGEDGDGEIASGGADSVRFPQPATWDHMIKDRDGWDSGAGVEMWVQTVPEAGGCRGGVWWKVGTEEAYRVGRYPGNAQARIERAKGRDVRSAVMVRVRRGREVDFEQDGERVDEDEVWKERTDEMFKLFEGMGWEEMKRRALVVEGVEEHPCAFL